MKAKNLVLVQDVVVFEISVFSINIRSIPFKSFGFFRCWTNAEYKNIYTSQVDGA